MILSTISFTQKSAERFIAFLREATPERCHRRLIAERMTRAWPDLEIIHLV